MLPPEDKETVFFHLAINKNMEHRSISFYNGLQVHLQKMVIQIDEAFITHLLHTIHDLLEFLKRKMSNSRELEGNSSHSSSSASPHRSSSTPLSSSSPTPNIPTTSSSSSTNLTTSSFPLTIDRNEIEKGKEDKEDSEEESEEDFPLSSSSDLKIFKSKKKKKAQKPNNSNSNNDNNFTEKSEMIYFKRLWIGPIEITLSYAPCSWGANPLKESELQKLLMVTGNLPEIDGAPLLLNSLTMDNPFCSKKDLMGNLISFYITSFVKGFYLIIGSASDLSPA